MTRYLLLAIAAGAISVATPVRAANRPHTGTENQNILVWTNNDLEQLHDRDLISIVGRANEGTSESEPSPQPYMKTEDPDWYAEQARRLRDELQRRKAQLIEYRQAIQDVESLKARKSGINLDESNIGITPGADIEILQHRVNEAQAELETLQDLARRNDIPPGTLRGR